ncbi:MAG TPA: hypothetical protein VNO14_13155, partial [Blastocatellia bacterium]|nr:hypothetical protein [Blastocatellia bacterium]
CSQAQALASESSDQHKLCRAQQLDHASSQSAAGEKDYCIFKEAREIEATTLSLICLLPLRQAAFEFATKGKEQN